MLLKTHLESWLYVKSQCSLKFEIKYKSYYSFLFRYLKTFSVFLVLIYSHWFATLWFPYCLEILISCFLLLLIVPVQHFGAAFIQVICKQNWLEKLGLSAQKYRRLFVWRPFSGCAAPECNLVLKCVSLGWKYASLLQIQGPFYL